jgi:hypothetical protein
MPRVGPCGPEEPHCRSPVATQPCVVGGRVAALMTATAHRQTQRLGLRCVRSRHGEDVAELLIRAEVVQGREQQ